MKKEVIAGRRRKAGLVICCGWCLVAGGWLVGCSSAPAEWPTVSVADADNAELRTRGVETARDWAEFETIVIDEPALVRASSAVAVDFFDRQVWVDGEGEAIFGVSPDTIYAFCVAGRVQSGGVEAEPGQVLLWTPAGVTPERYHVDVRHLRTSMEVVGLPALDETLAALEAEQADQIWWGALQPTGVNAVAATTPEVNEQRKRYLQDAEVVALRFDPEGPEALPGRVAAMFVESLRAGDGDRVAKLMSPKLGVEDAGSDTVSRRTVANALAARDWSSVGPEALSPTDDPLAWTVSSGESAYDLTLVPGDGLFYVAGFAKQP